MTTSLLGCIVLLGSCYDSETTRPRQYLEAVISNLEEIKSATYDSYREAWAPGDTLPSVFGHSYYKIYVNPADTALAVSWVVLKSEDTTQIEFAYDGRMRAWVDEDKKGIVIDSFKVRKLPFRPVSVPFYQNAQDILEYALNTKDSVTLNFNDLGDTLHVKLIIHEDRQVEFFGKAHYMPASPVGLQNPTSGYELWILKSTGLPYKYRREMGHQISVESVSNAHFNALKIEDFVVASYFPADYKIRQYGEKTNMAVAQGLIGKKAPEWVLMNEDGKSVSVREFQSKVVLVQFTSVNCGPCRASIPFLNRLSSAYNKEEFDLVAIESFTKNTNVLSTYRERTGLNYQFLMSKEEVNSQYSIRATPIFFILDEDRMIREIVRGYGGASTEEKIIKTIDGLM